MHVNSTQQHKVMITGAEGALGQELARAFWDAGHEVVGLNRGQCDITNRDEVLRIVRATRPTLIINAAANNQVDAIEDPAVYPAAYAVNALGPKHLAEAAKELGVPFVHYSTDYVFGGDASKQYTEEDAPNPINKYGETKAAGEALVREVGGQWYVCRVTKLFGRAGVSAGAKLGFFFLMRKLAREKPELKVVDDEAGNPTSTRDIALATRQLITESYPSGVYHLVNDGPCVTWYQFAEEIFGLEPVSIPRIPVDANAFGVRAAKRPSKVHLVSKKFPMLRPRLEAMRECMSLPKMSIAIVTLNVREIIRRNLRELYAQVGRAPSFEVIVVDNGSEDGTPEMIRAEFPQVRLIKNTFNSGFAAACNQGAYVAQGEVVIFFNPDMRIGEGALAHTYETLMARREIGVMGVKLVGEENGSVVESVRRTPGFVDQLMLLLKVPHLYPRAIERYLNKGFDYSKSQEVEQVRGSYFAMRRDVLNAVGYWDAKNFFVWFEEIDLCQRVRKAGYKVWYSAEVSCVDLVGQTFKQQSTTIKQIRFSRSMVRYFRKWHPWWQSALFACIRPFAIAGAFVADVVKYRPKTKVT